jgi:hypothetical protein
VMVMESDELQLVTCGCFCIISFDSAILDVDIPGWCSEIIENHQPPHGIYFVLSSQWRIINAASNPLEKTIVLFRTPRHTHPKPSNKNKVPS